jgi:hypothetical protein
MSVVIGILDPFDIVRIVDASVYISMSKLEIQLSWLIGDLQLLPSGVREKSIQKILVVIPGEAY